MGEDVPNTLAGRTTRGEFEIITGLRVPAERHRFVWLDGPAQFDSCTAAAMAQQPIESTFSPPQLAQWATFSAAEQAEAQLWFEQVSPPASAYR